MYFDPVSGLWLSSLLAGLVALGSLLLLVWADSGLSRPTLIRRVRAIRLPIGGAPRRRPAPPAPVPIHSRRRVPRQPAA
jgi:hypothetical protein